MYPQAIFTASPEIGVTQSPLLASEACDRLITSPISPQLQSFLLESSKRGNVFDGALSANSLHLPYTFSPP